MIIVYRSITKHMMLFIGLLLILWTIRIFESAFFFFSNHIQPSIQSVIYSINFDSLFVLFLSVILLPVVFINQFNERLAEWIYNIIIILVIIIQVGLTQFFLSSGVLLSGVVMRFSFREIYQVVSAEIYSSHFWLLIMYPLFIGIYFGIYKKYNDRLNIKLQWQKFVFCIYIIIICVVISNRRHYFKPVTYFSGYFDFYFGNNKSLYLFHSVTEQNAVSEEMQLNGEQVKAELRLFHDLTPRFKDASVEFPLVNDRSYPNVLGKFFVRSQLKPNIVILVVEGLSSCFSGESPTLGKFTPFLDSLAKNSLTWDHFLSNAEHSYGALPNILGSAPYGTNARGFINIEKDYPDHHHYPRHHTLVELLKQQEYQTRSFYGGELYFDQIGRYMNEIGLNCVLDAQRFNRSKYRQLVSKEDKTTYGWGYHDKDLFSQSLDLLDSCANIAPSLNVYITLSLHSPFNLCTKEYYEADYLRKRLLKINPKLDSIANTFYTKIISAALFTDDAIRDFFEAYKKRQDFSNTIFIITGDHRVDWDLPRNSELEFYHVPLIIYSTLLKETHRSKAISCHSDIVPSIVELLRVNFGMDFKFDQSWMGDGLDTSGIFNNSKTISLSLFNSTYPNIYRNGYLLSNDRADSITEDFTSKAPLKNGVLDSMRIVLRSYRVLNKYICDEDRIIK
jgi:phosphoglycerol transferase MdoB-like AlkP superfamily enzyme